MPVPDGVYACEVVKAGSFHNGNVDIVLRQIDDQFNEWFPATRGPQRKEMLATALTAISTQLTVEVHISGNTINGLYVGR